MSIADDPKFIELLGMANYEHSERIACGGDFGTAEKDAKAEEALIAYIDSLKQHEQQVWMVMTDKGDCVMTCPTEPTEEFLFNVATRIKKPCTYRAFYLRPAP